MATLNNLHFPLRPLLALVVHDSTIGPHRTRLPLSVPLALEALGADLASWEGRTALDLATEFATLGGDATLDLFEFAQAVRELETTKPPTSQMTTTRLCPPVSSR